MIFVRTVDEAAHIIFLRHPFGMPVAENNIATGSAMIIARIRVVVILTGGVNASVG